VENLEKTYDPAKTEDKWYEYWLENNYFAPREEIEDEKGTFSIVMPSSRILSTTLTSVAILAWSVPGSQRER